MAISSLSIADWLISLGHFFLVDESSGWKGVLSEQVVNSG